MSNGKTVYGSAKIISRSTLIAAGTVTEALAKIEASSMPPDAKRAVKDYIRETYNEFRENAEIMDFPVPDAIAEWLPVIEEIFKQVS